MKTASEFQYGTASCRFHNVMSRSAEATTSSDANAVHTPFVVKSDGRDVVHIELKAAADDVPAVEFLQAARAMLIAEHGPCAATQPDLLIATARRLASEKP